MLGLGKKKTEPAEEPKTETINAMDGKALPRFQELPEAPKPGPADYKAAYERIAEENKRLKAAAAGAPAKDIYAEYLLATYGEAKTVEEWLTIALAEIKDMRQQMGMKPF